jgi:predicted transcriptional regulator
MPDSQYNFTALIEQMQSERILVLDSMPGSGKTSAICQFLRLEDQPLNERVLFVTPFLSEADDELINSPRKLAGLNYSPTRWGLGGKSDNLARNLETSDTGFDQVISDANGTPVNCRFTATHAAFCNMDRNQFDLLENFTVIIDETLDVMQVLSDVGAYSWKVLESLGAFEDGENGYFRLRDENIYLEAKNNNLFLPVNLQHGSKFKDPFHRLLKFAYDQSLYRQSYIPPYDYFTPEATEWLGIEDDQSPHLYTYRILPREILSKARNVIILTHNFKYSAMDCWMQHKNLDYAYIDNNRLGLRSEEEIRDELTEAIRLYKPSSALNGLVRDGVSNGELKRAKYTLSKSSWEKLIKADASEDRTKILKSLKYFLKTKFNITEENNSNFFWTVPKDYKDIFTNFSNQFSGFIDEEIEFSEISEFDIEQEESHTAGDTSAKKTTFLPCNAKAINTYGSITNCFYGVNLFYPPNVLKMLVAMYGEHHQQDEASLNSQIKDVFALNALIQFIFRGSIRQSPPLEMNLLILADRSENLLKEFLPNLNYVR